MTNEISPMMIVSPYAEDLAISVQRSDADVVVALPFEERNTMHGVLHGGALASLVPISAFGAIHRAAPDAGDLCTVSLHMEYARAARKPVVAQTRAVRQVRELGFFGGGGRVGRHDRLACAGPRTASDRRSRRARLRACTQWPRVLGRRHGRERCNRRCPCARNGRLSIQ
jgi:uncharacterized protein (TIGR00369 family)